MVFDSKLQEMFLMNILWSIFGIIFGLANEELSVKIFKTFNLPNKIVQIIMQICMCSLSLAVIHVKINNHFGWTWQNITPGLFFVSFFFGVQYSIFNNIVNIKNKI